MRALRVQVRSASTTLLAGIRRLVVQIQAIEKDDLTLLACGAQGRCASTTSRCARCTRETPSLRNKRSIFFLLEFLLPDSERKISFHGNRFQKISCSGAVRDVRGRRLLRATRGQSGESDLF